MVSFAFRSSNSSTGQEVTTHHTQEVHPTEDREQTNKTKMGMKNKTTTQKISRVIKQKNKKEDACKSWATHAAEDHGKAGRMTAYLTRVCNALRRPCFSPIKSTEVSEFDKNGNPVLLSVVAEELKLLTCSLDNLGAV